MNPKIVIVEAKNSYIYLKSLLKWAHSHPETKEASKIPFNTLVEEIDRISEGVRTLFLRHENFILRKIVEMSGFEWSENFPYIYVYPTPFFNSISHPLFLRTCRIADGKFYKREDGAILGILIHELCHNNFQGLGVEREMNEDLINHVTFAILESIDPLYKEQYVALHVRIGADIVPTAIPQEIKDFKVTLKDYYRK